MKHLTGSFVSVSAAGEAGYFICNFFSIYSLVDLLFLFITGYGVCWYTKSGFSSFSPVMVLFDFIKETNLFTFYVYAFSK